MPQTDNLEINHIPENWWENNAGFFGRNYLAGDNSMQGYIPGKNETLEQRTEREVKGIINVLNIKKGSEILDIPCGYGRHSISLAKLGYQVTGVDINDDHLEAALKFSEEKNSNASFLKKDMRNIGSELHDKFDASINMFYSFGFFSDESDNIAAMQEFYNSLKKGGKFLLHTDISPEIISGGEYQFSEKRTLIGGGELFINESYIPKTSRIEGTWEIKYNSEKIQLTPYSVRIYTADELKKMAELCGFRESNVYGSFNKDAFTSLSKEMIFVAAK